MTYTLAEVLEIAQRHVEHARLGAWRAFAEGFASGAGAVVVIHWWLN